MKLSTKLMILSLFLVIVCCIGSVSATEDISDDLNDPVDSVDDVVACDLNDPVDSVDDDLSDNEMLGSSESSKLKTDIDDSDVLSEENPVMYVNQSHSGSGDGKTWETAYTGLNKAIKNVDNNGIIYLADDTYDSDISTKKNITFIAWGDNAIFDDVTSINPTYREVIEGNYYFRSANLIFKNITFVNSPLTINGNINFENCKFLGSPMHTKEIVTVYPNESFLVNFKNCTFKDINTETSFFKVNGYTKTIFENCTVENITADSLVACVCSIEDDGVDIHNSTFIDMNVNGVVDIDDDKQSTVTFENNTGEVNVFRLQPADSIITFDVTRQVLTLILKDAEGNPIDNGKIVLTSNADPRWHEDVITGNDGCADFDITPYHLEESAWTFYANYEGVKSRTQSVGPAEAEIVLNLNKFAKTLKVEFSNVTDVTGKTMLVVTVKNNLSEIVSNTNFTFTLNGKDYNATTDANGQFIASGLTGDVSVGVKYNGTEYDALDANSNFTFPKTESEDNTPSGNTTPTNTTPSDDKKPSQPGTPAKKVTPVATKITAKKATFKAKKKAKKYSITLKAGKKAVNKVKVTIKVGKKTYTAKTNAKGKATFNLKKLTKKGKYTAVIKFKGNKLYKASSKKVKIVVK